MVDGRHLKVLFRLHLGELMSDLCQIWYDEAESQVM